MALEMATAVASEGGTCLGSRKVEHGNVLYCACEDSQPLSRDPQRRHIDPKHTESGI